MSRKLCSYQELESWNKKLFISPLLLLGKEANMSSPTSGTCPTLIKINKL